jgi:hypothetical protein
MNEVAGFIMGPFAPKKHISALKKMPNSTKSDKKKGHHNLVSKSDLLFSVFLHQGL